MAPANSKANYKTYEAQARMVRAIVAAHPDVKWNYKEIVACYGSDMTEHALNHRFRRLKAQAVIIREGRARGFDMKHLLVEDTMPSSQDAVDKQNIAKYFGQSTADGIQFQFRTIKKDAERLRATSSSGGDVASCLSLPSHSLSTTSTPTKPITTRTNTPATNNSRKRSRADKDIKRSSSGSELSDMEDWTDAEETPSKRPSKHAGRPTPGQNNGNTPRKAAARANATIASVSAQLRDDTPDSEAATMNTYTSLFGNGSASTAPASAYSLTPTLATLVRQNNGPFTARATDPVISTTMNSSYEDNVMYDELGDGEI